LGASAWVINTPFPYKRTSNFREPECEPINLSGAQGSEVYRLDYALFQWEKGPMKTKKMKRLCVYCGSGSGIDPRFKQAALTLGQAMAEARIGLVYGGGGNGLMGTVAQAVHDNDGHVVGIIPSSLLEIENALEDIDERHVTNGFHERKMLMFNMSDGFVALPGGLGTLEELVEQLTWTQLGHHEKPVYIVNTAGYWDRLLALFDQMRSQLFIRPGLETRYTVVDEVRDVVPLFLKNRSLRRTVAPNVIRA
jgi:uncharacterized protein (TIGR00730 family)